ncbi:hypothetical protein GS399_05435 [Pedobacter sp. HMF7647]|uniref:Cell wall anchor protein n=1 Tax=Hufsiella arboris TaxID=2695275 RepID=A0A7K1Y8N7_9SPHI|nr:hypothetical protein [Hufsiella arboris]MXV50408.1 hypothetical protein [Hufsiella arboris]
MRKFFLLFICCAGFIDLSAQTLTESKGYQVIDIGNNSQGDYTYSLILLHEIYNGTLLDFNNVVGTLTAFRGNSVSFNRMSVATISSMSAYGGVSATLQSSTTDNHWKLKTCIYQGKKYMALDVPYSPAFHDYGYQFAGWVNSTGEKLKCVNYRVNGQPVNQSILTDIQDYNPNMSQVNNVSQLSLLGRLNLGTESPFQDYLLNVKGKIHAQAIKVELENFPDYVFDDNYPRVNLVELEDYIRKNKHLPEIPSAAQVEKDGIDLGKLNMGLLKKIEELTLLLIEQNKRLDQQDQAIKALSKKNKID